MSEPAWMQYILRIDCLDDEMAVFENDLTLATLNLPRADWESLGRPGSVTFRVRPHTPLVQ